MATKGEGTLKDHVGAKFDGVVVNDLPKFISKLQLGLKLIEAKPEKKHWHLHSQLTGKAWDVADKFMLKWETDRYTGRGTPLWIRDNGINRSTRLNQ